MGETILKKSFRKMLIGIALSGGIFNLAAEIAQFEIKPSNLEKALEAYITETGQQVIYQVNDVKGIKSKGVNGSYEHKKALDSLLEGTGLKVVRDLDSGAVAIVKTANNSIEYSQLLAEEDVESESDADVEGENVVKVLGKRVVKRDRLNTIEPTLVYDINFFQRFEPNNLADMLKRVPGVSFNNLNTTNVSNGRGGDNITFRGIAGAGGQILINGRRPIGANEDGSIDPTSISADIIQEVQVIRGATALIDSQGTGLTINLITKDGRSIPGQATTNWRVGYESNTGEEAADGYDLSLSNLGKLGSSSSYYVNVGYNTRDEDIDRGQFAVTDDPDVPYYNGTSSTTEVGSNQNEKISLNAALQLDYDNGSDLRIESFIVQEKEDAFTIDTFSFDGFPFPPVRSTSESKSDLYSIHGVYTQPFEEDELVIELGFDSTDTSNQLADLSFEIDATEVSFKAQYEMAIQDNQTLTFGTDFDFEKSTDVSKFTSESGNAARQNANSTTSDVDTDRVDFYLQYELEITESLAISLGARNESDEFSSSGELNNVITFVDNRGNYDYFDDEFLSESFPVTTDTEASFDATSYNAHARFKLTEEHELRLSYSNAIDIPNSNELAPAVFVGNRRGRITYNLPNEDLEAGETDTIELGWDWQFSVNDQAGVLGVSTYKKKSKGVIGLSPIEASEISNFQPNITSAITETETQLTAVPANFFVPGGREYSVYINQSNQIDNEGLEMDLSLPLAVIGLPTATLSSNVSYVETDSNLEIDSSVVEDDNDTLFFNVTLDHLIESIGLNYGVSYNKRDPDKLVSEFGDDILIIETKRDASIDVFVEKRFSDTFIVRLTVDNVNEATQEDLRQTFRDDQLIDSLTDPTVGARVYSLTVRGSF